MNCPPGLASDGKLLISASCIAKITGVNHWCPDSLHLLIGESRLLTLSFITERYILLRILLLY
jgi:hypothetical protein